MRKGSGFLSPYDLTDSIIHEHRHQKLYLLQSICPLVEVDAPLVRSPWREDLRPPSGLFHAVFVFCGLLRYWRFIENNTSGDLKQYASREVGRILNNLFDAKATLFSTRLTRVGRTLAHLLYHEIE